jgi:hypothetical protein
VAESQTLAENGSDLADAPLVIALAAGRSRRDAAESAGVSERTVYRRLEDPGFRARVHAERDELIRSAVGRLCDASVDAVETLRGVASDSAAPTNSRVAAARAILEFALKLRDQELADRVSALEAMLA